MHLCVENHAANDCNTEGQRFFQATLSSRQGHLSLGTLKILLTLDDHSLRGEIASTVEQQSLEKSEYE